MLLNKRVFTAVITFLSSIPLFSEEVIQVVKYDSLKSYLGVSFLTDSTIEYKMRELEASLAVIELKSDYALEDSSDSKNCVEN